MSRGNINLGTMKAVEFEFNTSEYTEREDTERKASKTKDTESEDTESEDTEYKDTESEDTESEDTEDKDTESEHTEDKDTKSKGTESKDTDNEGNESKDTEIEERKEAVITESEEAAITESKGLQEEPTLGYRDEDIIPGFGMEEPMLMSLEIVLIPLFTEELTSISQSLEEEPTYIPWPRENEMALMSRDKEVNSQGHTSKFTNIVLDYFSCFGMTGRQALFFEVSFQKFLIIYELDE
ncbi:hypothetical protein RUND412_010033 [Rhizina undulata]